jgi:AraC family transcriptional regulator
MSMESGSGFRIEETHQLLKQVGADIEASSDGRGWASTFVTIQREPPFDGEFEAVSTCLIVVPRDGPADLTYRMCGKTVSRVGSGGIFFLPAQHSCGVRLHSPLDTIHVYLRPSLFVDEDDGGCNRLASIAPILGQRDNIINNLVGAMGAIVYENEPLSGLLADTIAQALANRLIAIGYQGGALRPGTRRANRLNHRKVEKVREFVESNLATDIKLDAMASICGVSSEHFLRLFRSTMGVSPHQYVLNLRVGRAKAMLSDSTRSLTEVAVQCGFAHQQHLTSTFRRFTGSTPGRYRRP